MKIYFAILILFSFSVFHANSQEDKKYFSGGASFYAKKFEGRKTASGEKFSNFDMTCAHRKFPFNTFLKVTNTENNLSTIVRVNDRGPYKKGRIIDLSEQAARMIGTYMHGITHVKIETVDTTEISSASECFFESTKCIDTEGEKQSLTGKTISLWRSHNFLHCLLLAKHLEETEKIKNMLIAKKEKFSVYHLIITAINSQSETSQVKDYWERKGFMRVLYFDELNKTRKIKNKKNRGAINSKKNHVGL